MSIWLTAAGVGRRKATLVGWETEGQAATSITLPAGSQAGDYMVITYYDGITLGGGAGVAFTTTTFSNTKVSHRAVAAGDLTNPITFNTNGPAVLGVWRGPTSMSSALVSFSQSGATDYASITGITKSTTAMAIIGAANADPAGADGTEVYLRTKADGLLPGPFDAAAQQPTSGLSYGMGSITNLYGYANGTAFRAGTEDATNTVTVRIYELRG